jgi:hypothetical protein
MPKEVIDMRKRVKLFISLKQYDEAESMLKQVEAREILEKERI